MRKSPRNHPYEGCHRLFGLLWPVLAMSNATMAQAPPGAAASRGTLEVDMTPLAKSYQSMEIIAGFHNNCTGTKAKFRGSLRGGIPDGEGQFVPACDIPVNIVRTPFPKVAHGAPPLSDGQDYFRPGIYRLGR